MGRGMSPKILSVSQRADLYLVIKWLEFIDQMSHPDASAVFWEALIAVAVL
jgi:hypothetical protein